MSWRLVVQARESVHSRHFRTAETVETPADDQRLEAVSKGNGSARWVFKALGKDFDIDLTSNARLVSKMKAQPRSRLLAKHRLFFLGSSDADRCRCIRHDLGR